MMHIRLTFNAFLKRGLTLPLATPYLSLSTAIPPKKGPPANADSHKGSTPEQPGRPLKAKGSTGELPNHYDVVIVGAGIVGLATARELALRYPHMRLAVVEKEAEVAAHQSGHNSGVIHAGVYYTPGSLKARLCVEGAAMAYAFCDKHGIPYKKCGKLIVAVEPQELPLLDNLLERGLKNGVPDLTMIDGEDIQGIEPYCKGLRAIHSPHTGIVDWKRVTQEYGRDFERTGGTLILNCPVKSFDMEGGTDDASSPPSSHPLRIGTSGHDDIHARYVITCAGLYSDKVAELSGCAPIPKIVPFRGEYLLLAPEKSYLVRGNIYPVPNPRLPFLGVHFTPRMDGSVWLGPNAVLAFRREGYTFGQFDVSEMWDYIRFPGFRKLGLKYLKPGLREMYESFSLKAKMAALQRYVPEVKVQDVRPGPAGVRAQALDEAGNLVDDFVFDSGVGRLAERTLHVRNAPSPAATSSLAISKMIADKANEKFNLGQPRPLE